MSSTPLGPPRPAHSPWQRLYAAAHAARRDYHRRRQRRLQRPVISVGNLHWGGGGKTPVVAAVARHLLSASERVIVLSRGYGRRGRGRRLVSTGQGPLLGVEETGDEPFLLASDVPGLGVVVGEDRYQAGRWALERLDPTLFLLDDGFSHLALARDVDLLVFPEEDPFAGGRLLPSGRLREPLTSARHAHAALLTGLDRLDPDAGPALASCLEPFGFRGPAFCATLEARALGNDGAELAARDRVVLVTGVARPEAVARTARALDLDVVAELRFPDHHRYSSRSLARIRELARRHEAEVLTTAKDRPKLAGLGLPLAHLAASCHPEPAFYTWLDRRLAAVRAAD